MIIDGHCHVWPDAIAGRALAAVSDDMELCGDGTSTGLAEAMDRSGVDRAVALAVGSQARHVEAANAHVGGLDRDRFIPFGTVHAELPAEVNVASLAAHGLAGAKVHPLFQGYGLDHPGLVATLDAMRGDYAAIIHVGHGSSTSGEGLCTPQMLADLVRQLPGLDVIACHFGGYRVIQEAAEVVIGLPVMIDTSWPPSLAGLNGGRAVELIRRHGPERVVFASDWPTADPRAEIQVIRDLGLDDHDTEAILGGNLARLLDVEAG